MSAVKIGGVWQDVGSIGVKVSGTWKNMDEAYVKVSGTWKKYYEAFTYAWATGSYGDCSVPCGTGSQTRPVYCKRSDGMTVGDSLCSGTKPGHSKTCNTHICKQCKYAMNQYTWATCCTGTLSIVWAGVNVYHHGAAPTTTSITTGGFLYTRSTKKVSMTCAPFGMCGPGPSNGWAYIVCRESV